jgi:hypothetical protein
MWVKADMLMCVAFHRLKLLENGRDPSGVRIYDIRVLSAEVMDKVKACIRHSLGL